MEEDNFGITPPRRIADRQRRDQDEYMDDARRHLRLTTYNDPEEEAEEMDVRAVGSQRRWGSERWEPRSGPRTGFMASKTTDAVTWDDLKDVRPPKYSGNPLELDTFLEKFDE